MQGTRVLPVLLALAVLAGFVLHFAADRDREVVAAKPDALAEARGFVEAGSGLPFRADPVPVPAAGAASMRSRMEAFLDRRFGVGGLARRTRALELLGALPPGQNLREQFLTVEAAGRRVWFDDLDGTLYLAPGFDESLASDRAALVNGLARLLLHQHHRPAPFRNDDQWLAWRGVSGGLGASMEAVYRRSVPGEGVLPTSAETEREAALMALPIYVHGIAQFPVFEGRDFLEIPGARSTILAFPPSTTDIFFRWFDGVEALRRDLESRADASREDSAPPIPFPDVPDPLLVESLGALGVRLFFERHTDFDQANSLAAGLRADSYALFTTGTGDHLRWVARFADPADAARARSILAVWLDEPSPAADRRFKRIEVEGAQLTLYNSSEPVANR